VVFSFEWRGIQWLPMFQFDPAELRPRQGPQRVRAALPAAWHGWARARWFAASNTALGGRRPADLLDTVFEADLSAVVSAARMALPVPARPRRPVHV
jgi:hypothetical protein